MINQERSSIKRTGCFQVNAADNVATALDQLPTGRVEVFGVSAARSLLATEPIPMGHKIALRSLVVNEPIVKYGVVIGLATVPIHEGGWVHLHNCRSQVDERSSHLDFKSGAPLDTVYA